MCHERSRIRRAQYPHPGQSLDKNLADFRATQIASRSQHKGADFGRHQGVLLHRTVAKVLVFRQYNPAAFACFGQPHLVLCVLREMVVMKFDSRSGVTERIGNNAAAEGAVNEEDQRLRQRGQVQRGLLLQRLRARSRSPGPVRQSIRPPCNAPPRCLWQCPSVLSRDDRRKYKGQRR